MFQTHNIYRIRSGHVNFSLFFTRINHTFDCELVWLTQNFLRVWFYIKTALSDPEKNRNQNVLINSKNLGLYLLYKIIQKRTKSIKRLNQQCIFFFHTIMVPIITYQFFFVNIRINVLFHNLLTMHSLFENLVKKIAFFV